MSKSNEIAKKLLLLEEDLNKRFSHLAECLKKLQDAINENSTRIKNLEEGGRR